jgi:HlyD family secretion protein
MMRAEFDPGALESTPEVGLLAGMPTEVYVLGEKRTPMSYLWAPLLNSTRRSFRD